MVRHVDSYERKADAEALEQMLKTPSWLALGRLIRRVRQDFVEALARDPNVSRKETKGALLALDSIMAAVDDEVQALKAEEEEAAETLRIQRGQALEGGGTGDLI
jgi:hypothetical protein